jgi:hypothetical protein
MKDRIIFSAFLLLNVTATFAQQPVYPVKESLSNGPARVESSPYQEDRPIYVAEKGIEYKLTLGFPRDDQANFLRDSDAKVIVLWLKVENISKRPLALNTQKFTVTDKTGHNYARLAANDAFNRIMAGRGITQKAVKKGIGGISLGKVGGKTSEAEARDEATRFIFPEGDIPAQSVRQGLLYFEMPEDKTFTVNVSLDNLWPNPFMFTNLKSKK